MTRIAVAPNKFAKGFNAAGDVVPDAYEVLELRAALERTYTTDAHLVTYVLPEVLRQPRLNKPGLCDFGAMPTVDVFLCDVDNAGHAEWSDALFEAAQREYATLDVLRTAGVYHTKRGRRIVQPIAEPLAVDRVEAYLRRWLLALEQAGLVVDWACRDWTRHFRLPHVRRGGRAYTSPFLDLSRMQPVALEPLELTDLPPQRVRRAPNKARAPVSLGTWSTEIPPAWQDKIKVLADAVRGVTDEWHTLFLALAGALLGRRVPPEHVPAICRAVSMATYADDRTHDRELGARTSVGRWLAAQPLQGYAALRRTYPAVADAVDTVTARGAENLVHVRPEVTTPPLPLHESLRAMREVLRRAPEGLTVLWSECGLGKTQTAIAVAAERAATPYASANAKGKRAPVQSKTSISVDKNALALQVVADLRASGTPARRIFGPLSVVREDGTPECRYHATARHLVEGGQSMGWEFCKGRGLERCPHWETCAAREGVDGPEDARVTVGTHAMLGELDASAGTTGLLIIDEPPALLETETYTLEDFDTALRVLDRFAARYAMAMRPGLQAFRAWVEIAPVLELPVAPSHVVHAALESSWHAAEITATCQAAKVTSEYVALKVIGDVTKALDDGHRGIAPPIRREHLAAARSSELAARELGRASRVLRAVYLALTANYPIAVRVEERRGVRVLLMTASRQDLAEALKRQGAVVVMDANADLHVPVLAKVVGYEPRVHHFAAADGAPITRTLIRTRKANRRAWFNGGHLDIESAARALEVALRWATEEPGTKSLGIITYRALEVAIALALDPTSEARKRDWKEAGQTAKSVGPVVARFAPIVAAWTGQLLLGHYGAVRGLDAMAGVDALITIGDPWPNLGDVRHDVAFLGLGDAWDARLEALAHAELEQAHGRLRPVHRTKPGRALHVGSVLPGGYGWTAGPVAVREIGTFAVGRPAATSEDLREMVERVGGVRAAARIIGRSPTTIIRYLSGERAVSETVTTTLSQAAPAPTRRLRTRPSPAMPTTLVLRRT